MSSPRQTLYLIDGHAQIFRAYFAIRGGMTSPVTGEPTHAVFAFAGMLLKFLRDLRPQFVAMPIDSPGKTFRDEMYADYKATRTPPPDDFFSQEKRIFEMTRLFGIPVLGQAGVEADDIIATLVQRVLADPKLNHIDIRIVSKDKDLGQLLGPRVAMFDIHTDTAIDAAALQADKGVRPDQVVDLLTLTGDSADNIPGVPGVGPKTAAKLLQQYGSLDSILAHLGDLSEKQRESFAKAAAHLPLSRKLVELKRDCDIAFSLDDAKIGEIDAAALRTLFKQMGFHRHLDDLNRLLGTAAPPAGSAASSPAGASNVAQPSRKKKAAPETPGLFAGTLFDAGPRQPTLTDSAHSEGGNADASSSSGTTPGFFETAADCQYESITTADQLRDLVVTLRTQSIISFDTETIGLGHHATLCGMSLAWKPKHGVYILIRSPEPDKHLDEKAVLAIVGPLLQDASIKKTGHNLKYDLLVLRHAGVELRGVAFDSMIAGHLLETPGLGLDALALSILKHETIPISQLIGTGKNQTTMDRVPLDLITRYAAEDADVALRLYHDMAPRLKIHGLEKLFADVEVPLIQVLADMESAGIRLDPAELVRQKKGMAGRIIELRDQVQLAAGGPFNPDSPKQLAEVLFQRLKLPVIRRNKTGPSTDVEVLETLAELDALTPEQAAVPKLIVEYRQLTKLVNTYLDNLVDSIHPATGRIHASFHQTGAATGRLSSSNPNLQNIPIRTDIGRQIRKAFVAAPGNSLIAADYSQIELRILAHLSRDPALIHAFDTDQDIHAAVAAQVFNVPLDSVTREQRTHAKVINFGIVYGVTPYGLARRIEGLDVPGAKVLIEGYRQRYKGIGDFLDLCVTQARDQGYVSTMLGRRRSIPQIKNSNPNQRSLGERLAINSVVQGSAADLIKLAMIHLHRRIEREKLPMKLLLQIHDELVLESPQADAPGMAKIVAEEMTGAMKLRVPLKVDTGIGPDWYDAK